MTSVADFDAVILDIGGTVVVEAAPATATGQLVVTYLPRVVEDLRLLSGRVRLAAATNTAVMTEADVRDLLRPHGVSDLLGVLVTSADVGAAKPDPTVLTAVLGRLDDMPPARALYIGDKDTDRLAAVAIGMPFAWAHPAGILAAIEHHGH